MSKLDIGRFRKVLELMNRGATAGERSAARRGAEAMARGAGMSLSEAEAMVSGGTRSQPTSFFDGFDDWMERREPGYLARKTAERAARDERDALRRVEVLQKYGSEEALFARTRHETLLDAAIDSIATWRFWTGTDGVRYRQAETLDGKAADFWHVSAITPAIRKAVTEAYPWPSDLSAALQEVKEWDQLALDRGLFLGSDGSRGEWTHYPEVQCRILLLEHELEVGRPATSWEDLQARFDWKRFEYERQGIDKEERDASFLDRIEADCALLRKAACEKSVGAVKSGVPTLQRTNAEKRADVMSMLRQRPQLSDREIARFVGVSHQTVSNWRKKSLI